MRRSPCILPTSAEIQCARNLICSDLLPAQRKVSVTARFQNVDFTRSRPRTVNACRRDHPQCWPQPITGRKFRSNFHISVFEVEFSIGFNTGRSNRWSRILIWTVELTYSRLTNTIYRWKLKVIHKAVVGEVDNNLVEMFIKQFARSGNNSVVNVGEIISRPKFT